MSLLIEDIKQRGAVRNAVSSCKACGLRNIGTQPVPFSGSKSSLLTIVGEAPNKEADNKIKPFAGTTGHLLSAWLGQAGFQDTEVSYVNVVSCWPNRAPSYEEIRRCRTNLLIQLAYLQPKYVLALGTVPFHALSGLQLKMEYIRGKWFAVGGLGVNPPPYGLATYDPWTVLKNSVLTDQVIQDIMYVRLMIKEEVEPANHWCWYPGCSKDIDSEYRGLLQCAEHPLIPAGAAKKVTHGQASGTEGGSDPVPGAPGDDRQRLF